WHFYLSKLQHHNSLLELLDQYKGGSSLILLRTFDVLSSDLAQRLGRRNLCYRFFGFEVRGKGESVREKLDDITAQIEIAAEADDDSDAVALIQCDSNLHYS